MCLSGVDVEPLAIAGQLERLIRQRQRADNGVNEFFDPCSVELHIVGSPTNTKLLATCRQPTYQVRQPSVVGISSGFGSENG